MVEVTFSCATVFCREFPVRVGLLRVPSLFHLNWNSGLSREGVGVGSHSVSRTRSRMLANYIGKNGVTVVNDPYWSGKRNLVRRNRRSSEGGPKRKVEPPGRKNQRK